MRSMFCLPTSDCVSPAHVSLNRVIRVPVIRTGVPQCIAYMTRQLMTWRSAEAGQTVSAWASAAPAVRRSDTGSTTPGVNDSCAEQETCTEV